MRRGHKRKIFLFLNCLFLAQTINSFTLYSLSSCNLKSIQKTKNKQKLFQQQRDLENSH